MNKPLSNTHLLSLNHLGLIPGPDESEEDFMRRADYCLQLDRNLPELIPGKPIKLSELDTQKSFAIQPDWMPLFFSNYKLLPWHGGCAWIFQMNEKTPTSAFFQLRQAFKHSQTYLGIYDRDELIAHELSHVGRMMYQEPKFEEFHAYQTSSSLFRRWFGPIVQSSYESMFFVLALFVVLLLDFFAILWGQEEVFTLAIWSLLLPFSLLGYGLARLVYRHRIYGKCLQNMKQATQSHKKACDIMCRLTDKEIQEFGSMAPDAVVDGIKEMAVQSLRGRLIGLIQRKTEG